MTNSDRDGGGSEKKTDEDPQPQPTQPTPKKNSIARKSEHKSDHQEVKSSRSKPLVTGAEGGEKGEAGGGNPPAELKKTKARLNRSPRGLANSTGGPLNIDMTMPRMKKKPEEMKETHRVQFVFQTPKDETPLANLEIEGQLAKDMKLMEEYKIAIEQIHNTLIMMMRRGNGTTGMDKITSERRCAAPEKLKTIVKLTTPFWSADTNLQPSMTESIVSNVKVLAEAERHMQTEGLERMPGIKAFIMEDYVEYVALKKQLAKVRRDRPDTEQNRKEVMKKIQTLVKETYLEQKTKHLGELQSAFAEIGRYHHASASLWYQISERKTATCEKYKAEEFDFTQFSKPNEK